MLKVLIVEDEPIIQKGLKYRVNWPDMGCVVAGTADNGVEGIKMIDALQPQIVIVDIRMPFKDGIQMLKETKEKYSYEAVIISGFDEFDYAKQAIRLNVSDYLLKPIDIQQLEETIKKLVKKINNNKERRQLFKQNQYYKEILQLELGEIKNSSPTEGIVNYITKNYKRDITLNDISEELNISVSSLNNHFKAEINYSVHEFLVRYRILKALQLIQNEQKYIYEVATMVGFNNYKYFSNVFRKYMGMSPSEFMKKEETMLK